MKSRSLFFVAAALTMAGCSQNEVVDTNPDANAAIKFGVYTGVQTRGAETTNTSLKASANDGFGFLAYKTGTDWATDGATTAPSFLYNEHGTWNTTGGSGSGGWEYTNTRFWPTNSDKITFFAYAPYETAPDAGTNKGITLSGNNMQGPPHIEFEVKNSNNWNDMVDLVTDCRTDIKDQTATSNSGTVKFKFSHVLTKLANIKVSASAALGANTRIFVTGLKLDPGMSTLYSKAKYQFSDDSWVAAVPMAVYFTGDQDLSAFLNKTTPSFNGYTTSSVEIAGTTAVSLFPANQALYFIPVDNRRGTASDGDLKLKISYDLVMKDSGSGTYVKSTVTDKEIDLPAGTFMKGTAHTYSLSIQMNTIKIEVDDTWTEWGATAEEML